ncbi:MAG: pyruvate, phosphate dikinase [Candidatus Alcyoniella australis]|nr:pyruvate, phosphate dikinase [Candidatus Alcyoniella australis]
MAKAAKHVYFFGDGNAEGNTGMKNLLGGKGANLAEMSSLGIPVPARFTITTEVCTHFMLNNGKYPEGLSAQVDRQLKRVERSMGARFGDPKNPLLVSVRSGARKSMPGMMETVLNVGLNEQTLEGLAAHTGNPRFAWDSYRRLIQMYADVVMEKAAGIEPKEGQGIRARLERLLHSAKKAKGVKQDTELDVDDLRKLVNRYKNLIKQVLGKPFPDDAQQQLWGGIFAVLKSWNGKRANSYRRIEGIPDQWGTAVNVQAMVYGNMGENSATGVAFTRNPATGERVFYGEWLPNAQGEDVVAGIRTPLPINEQGKTDHTIHLDSLELAMPKAYRQLDGIQKRLEKHYRDMLDIEFTIQDGKLWMLQVRVGKRNGPAAVRMAVEMVRERMIKQPEAVMRVTPDQLDELLHPILDAKVESKTKPIAKGLPAGPGGAAGQVVFTADEAVAWNKLGKRVILVREETNPEDVEGMRAAQAVLTARGGMTSHAALVARGWGKCCIVGAGAIEVNGSKGLFTVNGVTVKRGDLISLNGTRGLVYQGELPLVKAAEDNPYFGVLLGFCDKIRRLKVRTNAETPDDAAKAVAFGAEGIGLFRTEHMFYGKGSEKPLFELRKMIVSATLKERNKALNRLFKYVKKDIRRTLEVMEGRPVTIRLLDPPLHEFVPERASERQRLAKSLGIDAAEFERRAEELHESNPMMGHRGVRLGVTYPEISRMQIRAVLEAAAELIAKGKKVKPEIMVPVTCHVNELERMRKLVVEVHAEVAAKTGLRRIPYMYGTMIEIPRAALTADEIAEVTEFFSFGTNDLTQMGFGFSRDDIGGFLPEYIEQEVLEADPFQTIDQRGIGELIKIAIERGRKTRPKLKVGICGEHGGDPASVEFCHRVGMDYVSCSPFRVPIARLAAAQAALRD